MNRPEHEKSPLLSPRRQRLGLALLFGIALLIAASDLAKWTAPLPAGTQTAETLARVKVANPHHFSFAVLGDNRDRLAPFSYLLGQIAASDAAFIVNTGDIVSTPTTGGFKKFLAASALLGDTPQLVAKGNHEVSPEGLYEQHFGRAYYSFRVGDVAAIILDKADGLPIDREQLAWLETTLEQAQDASQRLIFMHVPLFDPRGEVPHHDGSLLEPAARELLAVFKRFHVNHVFTGHIHGYYEGDWEGIPYTITGAAGSLDGDDPEHFFRHYMHVEYLNGALQVEVRSVPLARATGLLGLVREAWVKSTGLFLLYRHLFPLGLFGLLLLGRYGSQRRRKFKLARQPGPLVTMPAAVPAKVMSTRRTPSRARK